MTKAYDVIIAGSGITGSLIARYLSRYDLNILVIEKQPDVGMNPSSANSALIHAGYDPKPGTLKEKLNAEGNALWHTLAPELGIVFKKTGSLVVALNNSEMETIKTLYSQALENNIPGAEIIGRDSLLKKEPKINPGAFGALWAPTAAVIDPFGAVLAAAENAVQNGVKYLFNTELTDFISDGSRVTGIKTTAGDFFCKFFINAAGLYSDEISHKAGLRPDFKITPRKGSYHVFDSAGITLENILFPVPNELGKGILVSTTTHGNVLAGPDNSPCEDKEDTATTKESLDKIFNGAKKLIPSLDVRNTIAQYTGIRASCPEYKDFIIEAPEELKGFINLLGIDSPGFASAPAIALNAVELIRAQSPKLREKQSWKPCRRPFPHFHRMSSEEKTALIKTNPAYGRIVCRCEEVTEGEIIDALRSPVPAVTYDGLKRRTWLGTGRCQGAFDYPRVIELMAKEMKIPVTEVTKNGKGSELIFGKTK